jgi:hypothetical protein
MSNTIRNRSTERSSEIAKSDDQRNTHCSLVVSIPDRNEVNDTYHLMVSIIGHPLQ